MLGNEKGVLPGSDYYLMTPSAMAQEILFYPLYCGHFRCINGYDVQRIDYNNYLLMYVARGKCEVEAEGITYEATAGDLIFLNLAAEHKLNARTNFVWEIMGRYEGNASGGPLPAPPSGATIVSISPGLQYTMTASDGRYTTLEAGMPIPIIRKGDLGAIPDYTIYAGGYTVF